MKPYLTLKVPNFLTLQLGVFKADISVFYYTTRFNFKMKKKKISINCKCIVNNKC